MVAQEHAGPDPRAASWTLQVFRDALAAGRRRPLPSALLALALFAAPEAAAVGLEVSHLTDLPFPIAPLAIFGGQWLLGVVLQVVVTRAAMGEAPRTGQVRQNLRLAAGTLAWQGACTLLLGLAMAAGLLVATVADQAMRLHLGESGLVLSGATVGGVSATLLMARWALAGPALATRDHPGLRAALRRSAELSRGHRRGLAALQMVFLGGVLLMLLALVIMVATKIGGLSALAYLALLPITGLLLSFDTLLKVAAYRTLGGREAIDGAAGVAAVFE
ncbi:hypothetical protein ACO2Q3_15595 [Caulobacter sp. KR2-114]|uniref:hypothetical protein n=1 Tax=Caulobacter sp. KR2-114 TaxID=3400912 RepID=UPI003BFF8614